MTLIHRIAAGGDSSAWQQFLGDYWRPICLFAMQIGAMRWEDAEDIASDAITVLRRKELLEQWLQNQQARFKTLVCTVVRNLVSNWQRSDQARTRRMKDYAADWEAAIGQNASGTDVDAFFRIWADEFLFTIVEEAMWQYHREGIGDHFRILHARICDEMPFNEISELLGIKLTDAENHFKHAKQRLKQLLLAGVQRNVERYAVGLDLADEVKLEMDELSIYFESSGGLEEAIRRAILAREESGAC
jgi:RNA polymerase sigma factor (sigma-70 family)